MVAVAPSLMTRAKKRIGTLDDQILLDDGQAAQTPMPTKAPPMQTMGAPTPAAPVRAGPAPTIGGPSLMANAAQLAARNTIAPTTGQFDESKGVAGRVASLTANNSPLMMSAATKAAQAANARGLNSSTLGIQAGQQAVIETATPIANADANLYQQQGLANQSAQNSAATANATNAISAGMQGMGFENSNYQQGRSLAETARQFDTNQDTNKSQFAATNALQNRQVDAQIAQFAQSLGMTVQDLQLRRDTLNSQDKQALAALELQKSQLAQNQGQFVATNALNTRQVDAQIAQFAQNLGMTAQELQLRRDTLSTQDKQALATLELQRSQLTQNQGQFEATNALNMRQVDAQIAQFAQNLGVTVQDLQLKRDQLSSSDRQALDTLTLQRQQLAQQQSQFQTTQANTARQFDADLSQRAQQFGLTQTQQTALANLDATTKVKLGEIEAGWRSKLGSNEGINNAWGTMMQSIGNIQNNSGLENSSKQTLIQNTVDSFQSYATFFQKLTGVDVGPLLQFNVAGATPQGSSGGAGAPQGGGSQSGGGGEYVQPFNPSDSG